MKFLTVASRERYESTSTKEKWH